MHKPPRRTHISTGRFPFSRRSPSKRRAFLGVFNITKGFGRHDKCQRPRISLQIKRYKPITPTIIRRKHREIPIFCPRSVCRGLRLQNTRKNARRHHPPTTWREPKQKRGLKGRAPYLIQPSNPLSRQRRAAGQRASSLPAHSAGRKKPSPHEVRSEGFLHVRRRAGRELALCPDVLAKSCKATYATV